MKQLALIGLFGIALAGCVPSYQPAQVSASTPKFTFEEAKNADYGAYPKNYKEIVKEYYGRVAKDPDSLKYREITKPKKFANSVKGTFDYLVCATVNGKNSYGAYTGFSTDRFHIRDGKVVSFGPLVPEMKGLKFTRALDEDWCHYKGDIIMPK